MSKYNLEKRGYKIEARKTVAERLARQNAVTQGAVASVLQVLQRGFFGRLKWLLTGK